MEAADIHKTKHRHMKTDINLHITSISSLEEQSHNIQLHVEMHVYLHLSQYL